MYILLDQVGKQLTFDCMNRILACGLMTFILFGINGCSKEDEGTESKEDCFYLSDLSDEELVELLLDRN